LGGIGTIVGGVVGTYLIIIAINFYLKNAFVENLPISETLPLALLLILVLRYQPRGLTNVEPQFRNALVFGGFWSFFLSFYDAGKVLSSLSNIFNPAKILRDAFGENETGLLYLDMGSVEGRFVLYFIIGVVLGYYLPEINKRLRLKFWGVWPNLGKFDPPK
jgi:hypothetical protein